MPLNPTSHAGASYDLHADSTASTKLNITQRTPSYHDKQLAKLMKELRASIKPYPQARQALERAERRLRYVLRVVEAWDESHAERAELLLRLGNVPAANTAAWLVFDSELRESLLQRAPIGHDSEANERIAEALVLGREVLE